MKKINNMGLVRLGNRVAATLLMCGSAVVALASDSLVISAETPKEMGIKEEIVIETPEDVPTSGTEAGDVDAPQLKEYREYISQPFSKMKPKKLKQIEKDLNNLPDGKNVRAFKKEFEKTMAIKNELDGYWEVAKRPYEFDAVEDTKEKVFALESRVNPVQAQDIHDGLLTVLVRFRKGAITLQEIVVAFEKVMEKVPKDERGRYIREGDTRKNIVSQFEEILSLHKESIQKRIKDNPYLRSLYGGYVESMRMNPFNTGLAGVRNQIMQQNVALPAE